VGGGPRRGLRPRAKLYDALIAEQGVLPTRAENWHDLFNVVSWATFPHAKRALHARQFRRLAERVPEHYDKLPGARTEEQSALTRLDEGGMLVALPDTEQLGALTLVDDHVAGGRRLSVDSLVLATRGPLLELGNAVVRRWFADPVNPMVMGSS